MKARQFIRDAEIASTPVDIECLANSANAKIKTVHDLDDDESGQTTKIKGKHIIIVNGNHRIERQRFTALHEIAHIILDLPSRHHGKMLTTKNLLSYGQRPPEEILCDVFAAECLLPYELFSKDVDNIDVSFDAVRELSEKYQASLIATGSRFAVNANSPCAFILSEGGNIRYVSRSKYLIELKGWIDFNTPVPKGSVAHRLIRNGPGENYDEIASDVWFNGGIKGFPILAEESILLQEWNQCLSLIWLDEDMLPVQERQDQVEEEEPLLKELDGNLPWPSKGRRR